MLPDIKSIQSGTWRRSLAAILRQRRSLKEELLTQPNLVPLRLAILGGSTTQEIRSMLELVLLAHGIRPEFYESKYNAFAEEVLFEKAELWAFQPEIVFIHTTWQNISEFPSPLETGAAVDERIDRELKRFEAVWSKIHNGLGAPIIQNNFDLPPRRPLGNLEGTAAFGHVNFVLRLNAEFARYAQNHAHFLINDILYLSAQVGLEQWAQQTYWYTFHMALGPAGIAALADSVASIVKSVFGKSRKCLVLDLDNTLWGGIVGESGVQGLILGRDHPIGEAYQDFQRYVKMLQRQGVILAVCSKNDPANAREGFSHPDSILKVEDFAAFQANWNPKADNIREIARELNIGLDSIVFVDDNPAERASVAEYLPEVAVPDMGSDASWYADILDSGRYFERHAVVKEDLARGAYYSANSVRKSHEAEFKEYGQVLKSLRMTAEIGPFRPMYFARIVQLVNKTNQFNLTTRRYTDAEIDAIAGNSAFVTLYGRLADRFGDNGLVSVVIGRRSEDALQVEVWVMSCRVFNRGMEMAMFDVLVEQCRTLGIGKIVGMYIPSKKNQLVSGHYATLGFSLLDRTGEGSELWEYVIPEEYVKRSEYILSSAESSEGETGNLTVVAPESAAVAGD
jgi:FkbH-like protein